MTTLTTEQKTILNNELTNDPLGKGYQALLTDQQGHVVDLLNALTETKVKSRIITARGILSDYPGGPVESAAVLDKLNTAAPNISALKWAWAFITGDGIDIGHSATQTMIDFLTTVEAGSVLTSTEATNLKSLGMQPASRAEVLDLPYMTEELLRSR
jgi:hypothetical protein